MPRLRHIRRDDLSVRRERRGRGFSYVEADGTRITDAGFIDRARGLGIPPAWTEVRIAADPLAHIQASGLDAAGRVQYLYHPLWEERRNRRKEKSLAALAAALPRIRRRVREDLAAEAGDKRLAVAVGIALIDRTAMRVGRERYLDAHGTRGAGTLYTRDVAVAGDEIRIRFPAKSGKTADYRLRDATLAEAILRLKSIPGRRLLMYRGVGGAPRAVRTEDINARLREVAGGPVSAKDFRTLHASALAGEALARMEPGTSPTARRRQVAGVAREVAAFLQNTPAICRQSYIAPCLFRLFETGRLGTAWTEAEGTIRGIRQREARLIAVMSALRRPSAAATA